MRFVVVVIFLFSFATAAGAESWNVRPTASRPPSSLRLWFGAGLEYLRTQQANYPATFREGVVTVAARLGFTPQKSRFEGWLRTSAAVLPVWRLLSADPGYDEHVLDYEVRGEVHFWVLQSKKFGLGLIAGGRFSAMEVQSKMFGIQTALNPVFGSRLGVGLGPAFLDLAFRWVPLQGGSPFNYEANQSLYELEATFSRALGKDLSFFCSGAWQYTNYSPAGSYKGFNARAGTGVLGLVFPVGR